MLEAKAAQSLQKDVLLRIAAAMSADEIDDVAAWFTEDFQLHDPAIGGY